MIIKKFEEWNLLESKTMAMSHEILVTSSTVTLPVDEFWKIFVDKTIEIPENLIDVMWHIGYYGNKKHDVNITSQTLRKNIWEYIDCFICVVDSNTQSSPHVKEKEEDSSSYYFNHWIFKIKNWSPENIECVDAELFKEKDDNYFKRFLDPYLEEIFTNNPKSYENLKKYLTPKQKKDFAYIKTAEDFDLL